MMTGGAAPPGGGVPTSPDIFQENFDPSVRVPPRILRSTAGYVPTSMTLAHSTKVPLGGIIRPLAPCGPDEEDVAVVQPGAAGIVRCKR